MKIRIWSDLHADGAAMRFAQNCPDETLILAGDTANSMHALKIIVTDIAAKFKNVVLVLGNHEFYHGDVYDTFSTRFKSDMYNLGNVHLLNKEYIKLEDVTFIGATLWSDFNNRDPRVECAASMNINDFKLMQVLDGVKVSTDWMYKKNKEELEFIRNTCKSINGKKVVITHFPPMKKFQHPKWGTTRQNPINGYFMSDSAHQLKDIDFVMWVCGHTHDPSDFEMWGKRFICNPRGYCYRGKTENESFDINKVVEI